MKRKLLSKEEKRVFEVKVRLNTKEKEKLESMVQVSRKNSAEVIRSLLMKGHVPEAPLPILDMQTYQELRRIGVHYNQYVKAIHQRKLTVLDQSIIQELREIIQVVQSKIYRK